MLHIIIEITSDTILTDPETVDNVVMLLTDCDFNLDRPHIASSSLLLIFCMFSTDNARIDDNDKSTSLGVFSE